MSTTTDIRTTSAAELHQGVKDLVPILRERAGRTEQLRRIPDETMADLAVLGLFDAFSPPSVGGLGLGVSDFVNVVRTLAQGCASTAWVYGFLVANNTALVRNTPQLLGGRAFAPTGSSNGVRGTLAVTARPVDGGWRVTGEWGFVSGLMNAEYVLLGTLQDNGESPPSVVGLVVPVEDGRIEDVWEFSGMKGTGSNTLHLEDVFVPADRRWGVWGVEELFPPVPDSAMNVSNVRLFDLILTACAVGTAEGALDDFTHRVLTRTIGYGQGPQREHREALARYSDALVRTRTARLLWDDVVATVARTATTDGRNTVEEGALVRIGSARVCGLAREAITVIADGSGTSVYHSTQPLQRQMRDIDVIKSHATMHWDHAAVTAAAALLGLAEQVDPLIVG